MKDHAERFQLANEVHARPPAELTAPARASYVAVLMESSDRAAEHGHIATLCERYGVVPPLPGATHFSARVGQVQIKWERHSEFSGYYFFVEGEGRKPFADAAITHLPEGWLDAIPGLRLVAAHALLSPREARWHEDELLESCFSGNRFVGSEIGEGAGFAYTDFRIHEDGYSRFLLLNVHMSSSQAGRMVQRLFEIEAYRMLALLALPIAQKLSPHVKAIEQSLAEVTEAVSVESRSDEVLLNELSTFAAEVERTLSASQFRFSASRAYSDLVRSRIDELREHRLSGLQTINEFMSRRLAPAIATCATMSQRLRDLSERIARTSSLLSTRVDIAREKQNQALLASMERRARMQLRLQQTVEGLSVAAISYYVVALLSLVFGALESAGLPLRSELATGLSIPVVLLLVGFVLHSIRRRIMLRDEDTKAGSHR
jgi:uncharacterized membrane-anchored protein